MPENKPGHGVSLLKSFDPYFYKNIINQSFGRSVVYIMLLSFVVSFLISVKIKLSYDAFSSSALVWLEQNSGNLWPKGLGEIKIENGIVSSDTPQPYIYKLRDFVFILDTTGATTSLTADSYDILILKNKIIVKDKASKYEKRTREYDLSKVGTFLIRPGDAGKGIISEIKTPKKQVEITLKMIKSWAKLLGHGVFLLMLLVFFVFYLAAKLIQGAFFALLALLPNKSSGANLNYAKLLNLSLYALTPPTIMAVIIMLAGKQFSGFWLVYSIIYIIYMILGIKNIKSAGIDENKTPFLNGGNNA